ncbi:MAG: UDP-N-acetylglucosamine diphosphorylase/glucosamine-1-phosphate N-acetyltransferase [Gammaproteobacteria bacterium]|nr:UDP-N-acetylglucosamine diphosphorylase/glucosamine-1-phosphate N-acetyltransferase [Gammaproteobacteria bacterium]
MNLTLCILAAGQGKRMYSELPKVLHRIAGKPLVGHVLDTGAALTLLPPIVIYGHGGELLRKEYRDRHLVWVEQREQLGTGHAVAQALSKIPLDSLVLILYGDVPLLTRETLEKLLAAAAPSGFSLLTAVLPDPTGYGRIVRDRSGTIVKIVEHKDAAADELAINEINTGIMAIRGEYLHRWLPGIGNLNAQGEYYLTDCVGLAVAENIQVHAIATAEPTEVTGVNNRTQLAELERAYQRRQAHALMERGTTVMDPLRIDIRGELICGRDVIIDINAVFEGRVRLGDRVVIGPNCFIRDAELGDEAVVLANSVIEEAKIGVGARIGPFSRIRPETELGDGVHIGNFVEIKKSRIAKGSKVNHLAYVGDTEIGSRVNVGAGTITCNYDGAHKHKTVIEDDVFIGSDTQLVAPVTIGRGATIGAGTTVTENVEAERLVISRVRQKSIAGWQRPRKAKKE